jgi:hypothetical protein
MRRPLILAAGAALISVAALAAAADIPTRYSGSFPSDGIRRSITGTFTGTRLSLRFAVQRQGQTVQRTGSYSCTKISATQTRCPGTYQGGGDSGQQIVTITWSGGRPVATGFSH